MPDLVLASASKARSKLLRNAGLDIAIHPADLDETAIKKRMLAENADPADIALALAKSKSATVSAEKKGLVIGADQVLVHRGRILDKPRSMIEAAAHLRDLRGTTHQLISAVALSRDGKQIWSTFATANLTMRPFSDEFLDNYLDRFGDLALTSVGAYHVEGVGAQLFSEVEGDYFTILGLPLLELLTFLRSQEILPE